MGDYDFTNKVPVNVTFKGFENKEIASFIDDI